MKKVLLATTVLSLLPLTAVAESVSKPQVTGENTVSISVDLRCAHKAMYRYDLPTDENGSINFVNSLDLPGTGAEKLEMVEVVCLDENAVEVHALNVGQGPGLRFGSYDDMVVAIEFMQRYGDAQTELTYDQINSGS